jgi:thioredoxin 1
MFLAILGAAVLLAAWAFFRGGLKMKAGNALILVAVAVVVAGVAWFRSTREGSTASSPTPAAFPAAATPAPGPATVPAKEGELCPEPPPTRKTGETPTTGPTLPATSPVLAKNLPRVVDLGADKCKACKDLAPILVQLRKDYEGRVTVDFIDVWKNPKAGEPYKIRVIPTQVFFDAEGKEVWRHEGFLPKADFVAKFAELGVK